MTSPNFSCINAAFFFVTTNDFMSGEKVTLKKAALGALIVTIFFFMDMRKKSRGNHQFSQRLPLEVLKSVTDQSKLRLRWGFFPPHHSPVLYINHTFGIWITKVGGVWWTIMQHCFIDGIRGLVWENACWKARNTLLYLSHENQNKTQSLWHLSIVIKLYRVLEGCGRKHFFLCNMLKNDIDCVA